MLLALLFICSILSLLFIFKSEDGQYWSKLALFVFGYSLILSVFLLNDTWSGGLSFILELLPASTYNENVELLMGISIISLLCYFGFKAYRK